MKRIKVLLVGMLLAFSVPAMAQLASLTDLMDVNPAHLVSNYQKFLTTAGQYTKVQSDQVAILKLGSTATMGGYTVKAEMTTDLATGKSMKAIKLIPNSNTGIGKIVKGATGNLIGSANQIFYIDETEIATILATIEKMKKESKTTPAVNTTFTYMSKGGFSFSAGFVVEAKKSLWLGQIGETGDMPIADFMDSLSKVLNDAKTKLASFK